MSRHWKPEGIAVGRTSRRKQRGAAAGRGIRLTMLAGLFGGIVYASISDGNVSTARGGSFADPAAVSITDGDTFRYRGEKIRVADIDTPELKGRCSLERALAAKATTRMEALLKAGPFELRPIPGRDEDRYGRKLRIVTRNGRSLGDQMVAEGLARTWTGRREPWCGPERG